MSLRKRILRHEAVLWLAGWVISLYIRMVFLTSRWQVIGGEYPAAYWAAQKPFIGVFWHGRLAMMPMSWNRSQPIHVLMSHHNDAELIARAIVRFGLKTIRGSSRKGNKDKGGTAALRAMLTALKAGGSICITPDGPRGPRMRASEGVIAVARMSKLPILPTTFATSRRIVMDSWDRFILPLPFSRGVFIWGPPIDIGDNVEGLRRNVEREITRLTNEADRLCGQAPIPPDPEELHADA